MIHDHHISFHQKKTVTLQMYQIRSSLGLNPMPDGGSIQRFAKQMGKEASQHSSAASALRPYLPIFGSATVQEISLICIE